ncbi:hypothetical protein FH603_1287 [Spirosoma sp. LMG 31447]|uniref:Uncharacterized protein n=1 Tax=Spirosoma utsteinense TaxID=2585773 RepID=A0ABR6W4W6_9BACT|nr:hypothetical protein [Spirosoma utsteinense]
MLSTQGVKKSELVMRNLPLANDFNTLVYPKELIF